MDSTSSSEQFEEIGFACVLVGILGFLLIEFIDHRFRDPRDRKLSQ